MYLVYVLFIKLLKLIIIKTSLTTRNTMNNKIFSTLKIRMATELKKYLKSIL